jgi:hypothetical protein
MHLTCFVGSVVADECWACWHHGLDPHILLLCCCSVASLAGGTVIDLNLQDAVLVHLAGALHCSCKRLHCSGKC